MIEILKDSSMERKAREMDRPLETDLPQEEITDDLQYIKAVMGDVVEVMNKHYNLYKEASKTFEKLVATKLKLERLSTPVQKITTKKNKPKTEEEILLEKINKLTPEQREKLKRIELD